ncbi:MAG TPA: hypothetical protein VKD90_10410, partial [Gemmataceae bacterium]|nr:hypothetical protein [Gemmataceae bacterium]
GDGWEGTAGWTGTGQLYTLGVTNVWNPASMSLTLYNGGNFYLKPGTALGLSGFDVIGGQQVAGVQSGGVFLHGAGAALGTGGNWFYASGGFYVCDDLTNGDTFSISGNLRVSGILTMANNTNKVGTLTVDGSLRWVGGQTWMNADCQSGVANDKIVCADMQATQHARLSLSTAVPPGGVPAGTRMTLFQGGVGADGFLPADLTLSGGAMWQSAAGPGQPWRDDVVIPMMPPPPGP